MLPKRFRLPSHLIPEVLKKGKVINSPLFILKYLPLSAINNPLFAFLVSKKLDKRATVRNRIKRRLSEAVRSLLPQVKAGQAVIILAKKEILKASYKDLKRSCLAAAQGMTLK